MDVPTQPHGVLRLSEVIAALSSALDITGGLPEGHAVRTCLLGMRLAEQAGLGAEERSSLFYALLLKDVGCTNNAARISALFGNDDRMVKRRLRMIDWRREWGLGQPDGPRSPRSLFRARASRGSEIIGRLGFPTQSADAVRHLDEHWDGQGLPDGKRGAEIPLLSRIVGLAQTVEVFHARYGIEAAVEVAQLRSGSWFDPELVAIVRALADDSGFWERLRRGDRRQLAELEPADRVRGADDHTLDELAGAFALVVDAKSPWTYHHSEGVAALSVALARTLGLPEESVRSLRRGALLHDLGKVSLSNLILDKPGPLDPIEQTQMEMHPVHSRQIVDPVPCFRELGALIETHHERLDGSGYPYGLMGSDLTIEMRLLAVADVCDAMLSDRPYRPRLSRELTLELIERQSGVQLCPEGVRALRAVMRQQSAEGGHTNGNGYLNGLTPATCYSAPEAHRA